ncbi:GDSL esterase/lipase EXL3 [Citrus sinensis]|uniref:GDSL esterase/lipase EXL3 n=1 Tax=Citrus sinensis TaxID=2711 RepID=A0ACB8JQ05_CITSI|nr:GDSL esterase/lipase EXL3 [Citrus sinensis]
MVMIFLISLLSVILDFGWWSAEGCLELERSALLHLKHNFFNDPHNYLQKWVDHENYSDCCQWERVECNTTTGRVIALHFIALGVGNWQTVASRKRQLRENEKVPALIAFGDSILDTGNNNNLISLAKCNFPPYGKDFIGGKPTGRFSDGKVLTDLLAEGLGIKETVPAYLDPNLQSKDLATGVCFASGGSGLDPLTSSITSAIPISGQLKNFKEYIGKLKGVVGEEGANKVISKSLFLLSAGNNDLGINYSVLRVKKYDISTYTSMLVSWTSTIIKDLYGVGVRKIAIFSTTPVGCLPIFRTLHGGLMRSCADDDNKAAELFNSKLLAEVKNLNSSLPQAKIVYVDFYNPLLYLISNPVKSGFSVSDRSCCSTGTVETAILCNKKTPFTCANVSKFVFWDSVHPSERACRITAAPILQDLKKNFL